MTTVTESPNRRFRREAGLAPTISRHIGASDWHKFHLGDRVREVDGRHVGEVIAIHWSHTATVRWENGWLSDLPLKWLEKS